jgi:hypothetical protein
MSDDATKVGTVAQTNVLVQPGPEGAPQVTVESGGRAFGWGPAQAEEIAGLLIRAARIARAQGGCIQP